MFPLRHIGLSLIIGSGLILTAAPASAQEQEIVITGQKIPPDYEAVTQKVNISDLNVATAVGQTEMNKRVEHAVALVCPLPSGTAPQYERKDYDACRKFAMDGAQQQMANAIAAAKVKAGMK